MPPTKADIQKIDAGHPLYHAPTVDGTVISRDPHLQLGCGVVLQAVRDLKDERITKSLSALCWWLDEAHDWLDCLGMEYAGDKTTIFVNAVKGASHDRLYFGRTLGSRTSGHEPL